MEVGNKNFLKELFIMDNNWIEECYSTYYKQYFKGMKYKKSAWIDYGDQESHEHCLFCAKRISCGDAVDNDQQAYESSDERAWLCSDCFEKLLSYHKIALIPNNVTMVETGLNEGKTVTFSLNNERYILKKTDEKICVSHNGNKKFYSSFSEMKSNQKFYNKILDEVIDEIFMSIT